LVAIVKKQLKSEKGLYSILQILSVNAFEKDLLQQVLSNAASQNTDESHCNQLLFSY